MKRLFCSIIILVFLLNISAVTFAEVSSEYQIYIAVDGNDANDGTVDKPLRTLEKARGKILNMRNAGIDDNVSVILREGEYFRFQSLVLSELDYNIKFMAYPGESVTLTGAKKIDNDLISRVTDETVLSKVIDTVARGKLMQADLSRYYYYGAFPAAIDYSSAVQAYYNGMPMQLAKWPNELSDALTVSEITQNDFVCNGLSERAALWSDSSMANMYAGGHLGVHWYLEMLPVGSIDTAANKVTLSKSISYSTLNAEKSGVYFMNLPEEIDVPGECYFDRVNKMLYFYPPSDNNDFEISVPISKNTFIKAKNSRNITFENINMENVRSSAFNISASQNIKFNGCKIQHFTARCTLDGDSNTIENCYFYDGVTGGLNFTGGSTADLTGGKGKIENTVFNSMAGSNKAYTTAVSINGFEHTVKNCEIYNSIHQLVSVAGIGHTFENNEIHHGNQWMNDSGAVYWGRTPTTVGITFKNNLFHDNISDFLDGNSRAIYWDDRTIGPNIINNIFYEKEHSETDTPRATALASNGGVYANVQNNIFSGIAGISAGSYDYDLDRHIIFWQLCYDMQTFNTSTGFTGWWDNLTDRTTSGYFTTWKDYFKNTQWEPYLNLLSEDFYRENFTVYNEETGEYEKKDRKLTWNNTLALSKIYAPSYGINKFKDNLFVNSYERRDWLENSTFDIENLMFTDNTDLFEDYDNNNYTLTNEGLNIVKEVIPSFSNINTDIIGVNRSSIGGITPPAANNVHILKNSGTYTVDYSFYDADGDNESLSEIKWYSVNEDGNKELKGYGKNYTPGLGNSTKVIVEITPKDSMGVSGETVSVESDIIYVGRENDIITVSGNAEDYRMQNDRISITAIDENGDIVYVDEKSANTDGYFQFSFRLDENITLKTVKISVGDKKIIKTL